MNRNVMNPASAQEAIDFKAVLADDKQPLLMIQYRETGSDPESVNDYASLTVNPTGSSASKLSVVIKVGTTSSVYTQYEFAAAATGVTDTDTFAQCTDLGALVDAINDLTGFNCWRLHAPADYSLDSDDFIALSETELNNVPSEYLYRDASEVANLYHRIGVPREKDNGRVELIRLKYKIDASAVGDCSVKLYRDPTDGAGGENDEVELAQGIDELAADDTETEMFNEYESPAIERGPILIKAEDDSSMAVNSYVKGQYRSAEY